MIWDAMDYLVVFLLVLMLLFSDIGAQCSAWDQGFGLEAPREQKNLSLRFE